VVINKPAGISSAHAVAGVRREMQAGRAGHTGTLDPFARGVLVCCLNQATRLVRFLMRGHKVYEGTLTLGTETDTQDATGKVVSQRDWSGVTPEDLQRLLPRFEGLGLQTPPAYSALKHEGVPLYRLARQGRPVRKPPRPVHIYRIRLLAVELPRVRFSVCCSTGTYMRTLAADIGQALGCGGHLSELTRLESGGFTLDQALTLEGLKELARRGLRHDALIPMAEALADIPGITGGPDLLDKIRHGRPLTRRELGIGCWPSTSAEPAAVKVVDARGELAAVLECPAAAEELKYAGVFLRPER
jgi:tRNA pseudouridine55 synthase